MCEFCCFFQAHDKYVKIGTQIRDYEKNKYSCWQAETEHTLPLLMKKPLLVTHEQAIPGELVCMSCCFIHLHCTAKYCVYVLSCGGNVSRKRAEWGFSNGNQTFLYFSVLP